MNIRKYGEKDNPSLIRLWENVFPDDPPHNEPSRVLAAKLAVDDLIFVNLQIRSTNAEVAAFYEYLGFMREDRLSMGIRIGNA